MPAAATLKERLLAEIRGEDWSIPEIGRQFGCSERMVFHHFRYGLKSQIVNGKRVTTPNDAETYLRQRLSRTG